MNRTDRLEVTSHVGRDLLTSASLFKTESAVVWEYVVNSLQYIDSGTLPKVQVVVKPRAKLIEIRDNGRGMTESGLSQYFQMHGENIERLRGRPGRGKFGTGKSAAFGIGNRLTVDTRRNGVRNVVRLDRAQIVSSDGGGIPLDWIVRNEQTDFLNGTTVTIEDIFLQKLNISPIIEYIERHLQVYRSQNAEVAVNEHVCHFREPVFSDTYIFRPDETQASVLGDAELTVKISATPLNVNERGISVTAGAGNLVALETAGVDTKELGNYLFGEIDVPAIENAQTPIEPYDATRSLQLNPLHPVVKVLIPYIGSKLEEVRQIQVSKLRAAQKTEEARRLSSQASSIAELLNSDFVALVGKLQEISSASRASGSISASNRSFGDESVDDTGWAEGVSEPGILDPRDSDSDSRPREGSGNDDPGIPRAGKPDDDGSVSVDPIAESPHRNRRSKTGFNVRFEHLGEENDRSMYDKTSLTILINLDHPVLKNAVRASGPEDLNFRRLAYEIAFTEYAVALGYEMATQDPDIPADDLLFEVRSTLNRISLKAAPLYG